MRRWGLVLRRSLLVLILIVPLARCQEPEIISCPAEPSDA